MDHKQINIETASGHFIGHEGIDCQQEIWLQYVDVRFEKAIQKQKDNSVEDPKHVGTTKTQEHRRTAKGN